MSDKTVELIDVPTFNFEFIEETSSTEDPYSHYALAVSPLEERDYSGMITRFAMRRDHFKKITQALRLNSGRTSNLLHKACTKLFMLDALDQLDPGDDMGLKEDIARIRQEIITVSKTVEQALRENATHEEEDTAAVTVYPKRQLK